MPVPNNRDAQHHRCDLGFTRSQQHDRADPTAPHYAAHAISRRSAAGWHQPDATAVRPHDGGPPSLPPSATPARLRTHGSAPAANTDARAARPALKQPDSTCRPPAWPAAGRARLACAAGEARRGRPAAIDRDRGRSASHRPRPAAGRATAAFFANHRVGPATRPSTVMVRPAKQCGRCKAETARSTRPHSGEKHKAADARAVVGVRKRHRSLSHIPGRDHRIDGRRRRAAPSPRRLASAAAKQLPRRPARATSFQHTERRHPPRHQSCWRQCRSAHGFAADSPTHHGPDQKVQRPPQTTRARAANRCAPAPRAERSAGP